MHTGLTLFRALALCVLLVHLPGRAAAPAPLLDDYTHTAWTRLQNAPVDVLKITQTTDGWLWVATATGLYRFDGQRFERVERVYGHALDSSNVIGLTADGKQGLWVGYRLGGIRQFFPGGSRSFGEAEGLPVGGVIHIEALRDGAVWVGTRDGAAYLAPGARRFQVLGGEVGLPDKFVYQILIARDGTQWIGSLQGLFFRKPGQLRFTQAWPREQLLAIAEAPDGTIWARTPSYQYYRVRTSAPAPGQEPAPAFPGMGMRFGSDGSMWVLHQDGVERRIGSAGAGHPHQRLTQALGMSGPQAQCFFEDREGNVWIGTASGIDRIRRNRLAPVVLDKPLEEPGMALAPGAVLIGDRSNASVMRLGAAGPTPVAARGSITASHRGRDGTLWFGTDHGIYTLRPDGGLATTEAPAQVRGFYPQAMLRDAGGSVWVSYASGPLFRLSGGRWSRLDAIERAAGALALSMASDAGGALWIGHANNSVTITDESALPARRIDAAAGMDIGAVLHLEPDREGMWLSGERGVMLYRGGRLLALRGAEDERFRGVSGLVRTPDGDLWMHGADGIYHLSHEQLGAWLRDPGYRPAFERFDAQDGLAGHAMQLRPLPSLLRADDGKLWFTTSSAAYRLDPARIARNPVAPPALIRAVSSNGAALPVPADGPARLPKGADDLRVEFTALGLRMPERIRFRYRLQGVDADWQGPVERRDVFYTNLRPGSYRFEVNAANEDGVWHADSAALDLELPPTFLQSLWFKLALALALLALLYLAHVTRIRVLTQRIHERLAERSRIARSLHDTLLQSVQGLYLAFRAHVDTMPRESRERERLAHTLRLAEQLLEEGRNEIMDLRTPSTSGTLFDALSEFGHTLTLMGSHAFDARLTGKPRKLRPQVHNEIYAIGRELLFNAARYSQARTITLAMDYGRQELVLTIRDDGRGMAAGEHAPPREGSHWGLQGILERARAIGADLKVASEAGRGTSVCLRIRKQLAYENRAMTRRAASGEEEVDHTDG